MRLLGKVDFSVFLHGNPIGFAIGLFGNTKLFLSKPVLLRDQDQSIGQHSRTFVLPQLQVVLGVVLALFRVDVQYALPDARQISQIEDVMEFRWRGQAFVLHGLPKDACGRDGLVHEIDQLVGKLPFWTEVFSDGTEDVVDGAVRWQRAIQDEEVPFEPFGNVVAASAWVAHGCEKLQIDDVEKVAGLCQRIEASLFDQLPENLVGLLIAPRVDHGHVDVVDEDGHLAAKRWTERVRHTLIDEVLDRSLNETARGNRGEVHRPREMLFAVVVFQEAADDHRFRGARLADQQHGLLLFGECID